MKILIILDVIDSGGVSTVLRNMLNHIDLKKYHFVILSFEENSTYESMLPPEVEIRHLYKRNPAKCNNQFVRYAYIFFREFVPKWLIRKFIIKRGFDLAIDFKGNNLNVLTAAKCKKIYWSHKDFSSETNPVEKKICEKYAKTRNGKAKENFFRKNLSKVDTIVCISEPLKKSFSERWGHEEKISVLHNVLDVEEIRDKANEKIDYLRDDKFTFECMSRISAGKGIERLLECVEKLNRSGYKFNLNIIGGGDTYQEMEKLCTDMKLENVSFFGHKNNPYPYLKECDVFVYPSETEAYSMALCEALIIGKPVITAKTASVSEIIGDNLYGVVTENSTEGILNGMKLFLDKPHLCKKYEALAQKRAYYFDTKSRILAIERFFDEVKESYKAL